VIGACSWGTEIHEAALYLLEAAHTPGNTDATCPALMKGLHTLHAYSRVTQLHADTPLCSNRQPPTADVPETNASRSPSGALQLARRTSSLLAHAPSLPTAADDEEYASQAWPIGQGDLMFFRRHSDALFPEALPEGEPEPDPKGAGERPACCERTTCGWLACLAGVTGGLACLSVYAVRIMASADHGQCLRCM
jgi:hypothetical protein